ncbi:MAG TPA: AMP-binding protein [Acidimicrobiales bacterium]|nr:AMP-binding protein [Acidimicrobiales bacterium]
MAEGTTASGGLDDVAERQLRRWAGERPDATGIVDEEGSLSYAQVDRLVDDLAVTLAAGGVGTGDVVTIWMPAWWQASVAFLAANRIGAVAHPMSDVLGVTEAMAILRRVQPRAVVYGASDPAAADRMAAAATDAVGSALLVRARDLADPSAAARSGSPAAARPGVPTVEPDPDRACALVFTSGTTSEPKGVLHSHRNLGATVRDVAERVGVRDADVIGLASPIGHVRWVMFGCLLPFLVGGTLFTCARWRPAEWTGRADEVGCRFAAFSPKHLEDLVAQAAEGRRCRALEVVTCGGSFLSTPQLRRSEEALGVTVLRSYGCTEFPSAVGGGVDDPPEQRWQYDGRPLAGVEVRLERGDDDDVVRLGGSGPMGRICLRGTHAAAGVTDADGWYRTEDFGELVDGWLRVLGRSADIIIRNGENISANEVEGFLSGYPGLGEFAVVGRQDLVAGERVCLVVVGPAGTAPGVDDVSGFLGQSGVMKQKWPESVVEVDSLPRTPNGKLVRRRLWELVNDGGPES